MASEVKQPLIKVKFLPGVFMVSEEMRGSGLRGCEVVASEDARSRPPRSRPLKSRPPRSCTNFQVLLAVVMASEVKQPQVKILPGLFMVSDEILGRGL